jgi:hypothetical protein
MARRAWKRMSWGSGWSELRRGLWRRDGDEPGRGSGRSEVWTVEKGRDGGESRAAAGFGNDILPEGARSEKPPCSRLPRPASGGCRLWPLWCKHGNGQMPADTKPCRNSKLFKIFCHIKFCCTYIKH